MRTKENYSEIPVISTGKETPCWLCRLKTNKYLLVGSFIVLCLVLFLMIKFKWFLWVYVGLSLLVLLGIGIFKLDFQKRETGKVAELETAIESLSAQNISLNTRILDLEKTVSYKDNETKQLKLQLDSVENDYKLENKYLGVLIFVQFLERSVDDLPDSTIDFKKNIHKRLQVLLATYGYKFVNYEPQHPELYDYEYYHTVDAPEVVGKTIIDKNGDIALKGKVYLHKDYETE